MIRLITLAVLLTFTQQINASTVGTLLLQGSIAQILTLDVLPESVASNLDLTASQTNLSVATLQVTSNSTTGYQISVSSANSGELLGPGSTTIPYTMNVGGTAVDLSITDTVLYSSIGANLTHDVDISYTGVDINTTEAGNYSDTITFTLSAQ